MQGPVRSILLPLKSWSISFLAGVTPLLWYSLMVQHGSCDDVECASTKLVSILKKNKMYERVVVYIFR